MVWDRSDTSVHAVDVTDRYSRAAVAADDGQTTLFVRAFATRGGERIGARVFPEGLEPTNAVLTKTGTADLNDMPAIRVAAGAPVVLFVSHDGEIRRLPLPATDRRSRTIEIFWDELSLGRADAEAMVEALFRMRSEQIALERADEIETSAFIADGQTLRFLERTFGEAPESKRSLWISMHGGGGAPAEVNDQQWRNQIGLYEPNEGVYIAPRAPTDTWNLWHQGHIDTLFDRLIETFIATRGIDPDRVYLLGYSAGGDGVYQLAPRMADRFAAAAMMAGHPNETVALGLRNLPFAIFMGGEDSAYDRNARASDWEQQLAELHNADPEGYPHRVTIYEGLGHWMEGRDAEALPWMLSHVRDPWPRRIVWHQDDVTHDRFYWLSLEPDKAEPRSTVTAEVEGQTIRVAMPETLGSITLRLHDRLVDLDEPVVVEMNGERVFEGSVLRTRSAIERSLLERNDPRSAAFAELVVRVP